MNRLRRHLNSGRIPVVVIIIALIGSLTLGVLAVRGAADKASDRAAAAERASRANLLSSVEFTEAVERRINSELNRRTVLRDAKTCLLLDATLTQPQPTSLRRELVQARIEFKCMGVTPTPASVDIPTPIPSETADVPRRGASERPRVSARPVPSEGLSEPPRPAPAPPGRPSPAPPVEPSVPPAPMPTPVLPLLPFLELPALPALPPPLPH